MEDAWQTVLAILASFGGAGVIILAVSKWVANLTAERILKKSEFQFLQKLEALKSELEKKNYISKIRFDLEIEVYKELSKTVLKMVFDNNVLWPMLSHLPQDNEERKIVQMENLQRAIESYNVANAAIMTNAPFIPREIYETFVDIRNECRRQISLFQIFKVQGRPLTENTEKWETDCYLRTEEIGKKLDALLGSLREHIASLEVLDKE